MDFKINFTIKVQNFDEVIKNVRAIFINSSLEQNAIPSRGEQTLIITNKEITLEDVRDKLGILSTSGKTTLAKQILAKYNAQKISDVKSEDYENLYTEITKVLN